MSAAATCPPPALRDYRLADNLGAGARRRLPDRHAGAGPLAADAAPARRGARPEHRRLRQRLPRLAARHGRPAAVEGGGFLEAAEVQFLPAINEDLAATACLGTQRVALDPKRTVEACSRMWYGKGPGVDRSGDALKHGNVYGHRRRAACSSSRATTTAASRRPCRTRATRDAGLEMPVLHPANVAEYLEFGLYGWALSRFSGAWVGFKAISEVVESGMTVDLDAVPLDFTLPVDFTPRRGLPWRAVDLPSLELEARLPRSSTRCAPSRGQRSTSTSCSSPNATPGHRHRRQGALRLHGGAAPPRARPECARRRGRAHLQGRPRVPARADADERVRAGAGGDPRDRGEGAGRRTPDQGAAVRRAAPVRARASPARRCGRPTPLLSALGELRPSRIMPVVADWLARLNPLLDRRASRRRLHDAARCSPTRPTRSGASPISARAARTTVAPRCPKARARWPASAATSWRAGWNATRAA